MERRNIAVCLIVVGLIAVPVQAEILYDLIDLGTLGGYSSVASSINNSGQIVGWSKDGNGYDNATLFDNTGKGNNIDLLANSLPDRKSYAYSINNDGLIARKMDVWYPQPTIFYQMENGNYSQSSYGGGVIRSINDFGQFVGSSGNNVGSGNATIFVDPKSPTLIYLGALGGDSSIAQSNNNLGEVIGWARTSNNLTHATLFDITGNGNNIDLDPYNNKSSQALSINDNSTIVGWAAVNSEQAYATIFDSTGNGNNINLGGLGGSLSRATSLNNTGEVVGWARNVDEVVQATLFDPSGLGNNINLNSLIDPSLGWQLSTAYDINDNGWIVGSGINGDGRNHAFLLKPVPEPASLIILGIGALFMRKRESII